MYINKLDHLKIQEINTRYFLSNELKRKKNKHLHLKNRKKNLHRQTTTTTTTKNIMLNLKKSNKIELNLRDSFLIQNFFFLFNLLNLKNYIL